MIKLQTVERHPQGGYRCTTCGQLLTANLGEPEGHSLAQCVVHLASLVRDLQRHTNAVPVFPSTPR